MIEQLKTFEINALAFEIIDGFTETDEKIAQKLFDQKVKQGFNKINILIKLDELKISNSSIKAFFEDSLFSIRNLKNLGNIAIVGHSNILKTSIPIDSFFFKRLSKGFEERYFDISNIDKAFEFIQS